MRQGDALLANCRSPLAWLEVSTRKLGRDYLIAQAQLEFRKAVRKHGVDADISKDAACRLCLAHGQDPYETFRVTNAEDNGRTFSNLYAWRRVLIEAEKWL